MRPGPSTPSAGPSLPLPPTGGHPHTPSSGRTSRNTAGATGDARRPSPQVIEAGRRGRDRRVAFAKVKAEVAAHSYDRGRIVVANHLRCPNDTVAGMRIGQLLMAIRFVGEPRMLRVLAKAGVRSAQSKVGGLTDRQRREIAVQLERGVGGEQ